MNCTIAASTSDTIRVWNLEIDGTVPKDSMAHRYNRRGSGYNSGEQTAILTKSIFDADPLPDTIGTVSCMSWASDGSTFVVGGKGRSMRQLDSSGAFIQDIEVNRKGDHDEYMDIIAAEYYGNRSESLFVANNTKRQVRRWDFVKKEYGAICQTHENDISCMAVSSKKKLVVSATSFGGEIAVFNLVHNTRSDLRSATHRAITCVDISPGHRAQISVGSEDGLVQLFDYTRSDAAPIKAFSHVHSAPIRGICFHKENSSTVVSVGLDGRLVITDADAYAPRSVGGSGGSRSALEIAAETPLTCLSSRGDPFVVAAGTIDGEVLVFDIRGQQKPLWRGAVGKGRPVTSLSFAPVSTSGPISGKGVSQRVPRSNPYDGDGVAALLAECRSRRSLGAAAASDKYNDNEKDELRENNPPLSGSAANGAVKSNSNSNSEILRPPQHPIINRHRLTAADSTPIQSAYRARTKALLGSMASESKPAASDEMHIVDENASIMRSDRSFMDLLSPEKPGKTTYQSRRAALDVSRENFLAALSRMHAPAAPASSTRFRNSLLTRETGSRYAGYGRTPYDRETPRVGSRDLARSGMRAAGDLEPSALPEPLELSKSHDVGDSMMEMLSPERKKPKDIEGMQLISSDSKKDETNGLSSVSSNKRVSQLFDRHRKSLKPSADRTPSLAANKRASVASASVDSSATESVEEVFQTHSAKEQKHNHRLSGSAVDGLGGMA
ncbi:hypothetical protein J3B02_002991, partial [Coemansia erecta]